jgi:hypothetical protein
MGKSQDKGKDGKKKKAAKKTAASVSKPKKK